MSENKVKVALVGIGNLSSALVQAIEYYRTNNTKDLMYEKIGGFAISDIVVVAAYDIDERKVGKDLSEAIFAKPNNKHKVVEVPVLNLKVEKAPVLDGISEYSSEEVIVSKEKEVDMVESLKKSGAELLIINVPSGSDELVLHLANVALEVGLGVINSTPSKVVRDTTLVRKFKEKGLPMFGDDLQSQTGGTIFHKGLLEVLHQQGVKLIDSYSLDVSGGLEGLNTLDYSRRSKKRGAKEDSIKRSLPYDVNIASGTTDYLDFLGSTRLGHYWIYGKAFLGHEIKIDIRMETDDGASGAASLVDIIRAAKIALGRGVSGPVYSVCANLFKIPPEYHPRLQAIKGFKEFISGERDA
ncbi:MAG: inositol-3-phosphate synthase [Candidatus Heimdallarchaeota archaeon]|nr:inositol-3-phosphate synthase [Candidatus Heimdallarchaeota archaeon]